MSDNAPPLLINSEETCRLIGVKRTFFYSMRLSEAFAPEPIKLGKKLLYRRTEVEDWVRQKCPPKKLWRWEGK